jgi:DNA gyrase subunit B
LTSEDDVRGLQAEIAMQWNGGFTEAVHTFANTINTTEGGTHEEGFRAAMTTLLNKFAREWGILKDKDANLSGEDVREGITAIVSVKLRDPQFEGQTKGKLGNTEMKAFVQKVVNDQFGAWLEQNPAEGKDIARKSVNAATARLAARKARDLARNRKGLLGGAGMPGKLIDCSSREPEAAPGRAAIHAPRQSSRSAARSSTSRRPASTRCCKTMRCRRSSRPSAPAYTMTLTSTGCAITNWC